MAGVPTQQKYSQDRVVDPIPCVSYCDQPGFGNDPFDPKKHYQPLPDGVNWTGQTDPYHVTYNMAITVTCLDSNGMGPPVGDQKPVTGDYQFTLVLGPGNGTITIRKP